MSCGAGESLAATPIMANYARSDFDPSLSDLQMWTALGGGVALALLGARRRSLPGMALTLAATPLVYRGLKGHWPDGFTRSRPRAANDTRTALAGPHGIHVCEAVYVEKPITKVYQFWRRLENLPRFMQYLEDVRDLGNGRSHWVVRGPAGVRVEWDAEIINEVEPDVIGWRSLPGADVVTAGAVNFDTARGGRGTTVTVHLQYAPPAGRAGALVAQLFGREPSQTVREDMRRLKQVLEAGEIARSGAPREMAR
jgi:uncharacterized membrane protein